MSQDFFTSLSTEILLNIYGYLDFRTLCKLRLVCKRFQNIIDIWAYTLLKEKSRPLVTNQENDLFSNRSQRQLTGLQKILIYKNWESGAYKDKYFVFGKNKLMPWLHLTNQSVWCSKGEHIFEFERSKNKSVLKSKPISVVYNANAADFTKYNIKNDRLVAGTRDGNIVIWPVGKNSAVIDSPDCHSSDINCVDVTLDGQVIVSGSRDELLKIWNVRENSLEQHQCVNLGETVWTVSLSDLNKKLAVGTSGLLRRRSLMIYDLESFPACQVLNDNRILDKGILDVKWDGVHSVWSCGYDSCLSRWDLRTGRNEQTFPDVCCEVLYCFDLDYYNTAITGVQRASRVSLWDIRQRKCAQLYFVKNSNSPAYSVAFDADILFVALDKSFHFLDFRNNQAAKHDYSVFLNYRFISD